VSRTCRRENYHFSGEVCAPPALADHNRRALRSINAATTVIHLLRPFRVVSVCASSFSSALRGHADHARAAPSTILAHPGQWRPRQYSAIAIITIKTLLRSNRLAHLPAMTYTPLWSAFVPSLPTQDNHFRILPILLIGDLLTGEKPHLAAAKSSQFRHPGRGEMMRGMRTSLAIGPWIRSCTA